MSVTIYPSHAYAFLSGLFLGKLTNFASDIVITGLVLYIVTPEIFTHDRMDYVKKWCYSWFEKKTLCIENGIELSQLNLTEEQQKKLETINKKNYPILNVNLPKIELLSPIKK